MINVMVIEDRILTLNALKSQIPVGSTEYRSPVGFYTNCKEAMAHMQETAPDVIISDIGHAGNGWSQLLRVCKWIEPEY